MPFTLKQCDSRPAVIDNEIVISDETELAELVAYMLVGHYLHSKQIIKELNPTSPLLQESEIDLAIKRIGRDTDITKRDGWIFQMISWLALQHEYKALDYRCQPPHDAPAQHGLDGLAIILEGGDTLAKIIITEDKCTAGNQRSILPEVWKEFISFEGGIHNNKLVSRISPLIEHITGFMKKNENNIYEKNIRSYRVGINRSKTYETIKKRGDLFKGYSDCVPDLSGIHRRYAATMLQEDIRNWMQQFCDKITIFLNSLKKQNV
ncbi:hypothetical protein [Deminuibacter soli]|uniref:DUF1837 domain-containing protein n=1 Tax=Deminuibacter soli TaxID=2291815 RepID=A0A3E1NLB2_9BACT|nr:hypothetical protein [Deminuibacter soli]RFM28725.1 hypothetical protein DXN05_08050 [Deminuibacter soli]